MNRCAKSVQRRENSAVSYRNKRLAPRHGFEPRFTAPDWHRLEHSCTPTLRRLDTSPRNVDLHCRSSERILQPHQVGVDRKTYPSRRRALGRPDPGGPPAQPDSRCLSRGRPRAGGSGRIPEGHRESHRSAARAIAAPRPAWIRPQLLAQQESITKCYREHNEFLLCLYDSSMTSSCLLYPTNLILDQ